MVTPEALPLESLPFEPDKTTSDFVSSQMTQCLLKNWIKSAEMENMESFIQSDD